VLAPQHPFGYFVSHQGDLAGWRQELTGEGFVLDEISPNFFHAKIPDNGSVKVNTKIGTCEHVFLGLFRRCSVGKNPGCSCQVGSAGESPGGVLLFALSLVGASLAGRRRRYQSK
jgi:MYXO-CTERM domain-containing protein